jgi:urease accessory protein
VTVNSASLLLLLQHADSAFPSGGFAFSQGLEASSLHAGKIGPLDFEHYVRNQLAHRWATADRVALSRAHRLAGDREATVRLDREVEASSAIDIFRAGSKRNGMAFLTAHRRLGSQPAADYTALVRDGTAPGYLPVVQGLVWSGLGMSEADATLVSGYQCAMSLATAAVRLGVLGAIEAQAALGRLLPVIEGLAGTPVKDGEPLSSFTPLSELAVLMRETSGQRLFSS